MRRSNVIVAGNLDFQKALANLDSALHDTNFIELFQGAPPSLDIQSIVPEKWEVNVGCSVYSFAVLNVKRYWKHLKQRIEGGGEPDVTALLPHTVAGVETSSEAFKQWVMAVKISNEIIDCLKTHMKSRRIKKGHEGTEGHTGWPDSPDSAGCSLQDVQKMIIPCKISAMRKRGIQPKYKGVGYAQNEPTWPGVRPVPGPPAAGRWVEWREWVMRPRRPGGPPLTTAPCPCVACDPNDRGPDQNPECFIRLTLAHLGPDGPVGGSAAHDVTVRIISCNPFVVELQDMLGIQTPHLGPVGVAEWKPTGTITISPAEEARPTPVVVTDFIPEPRMHTPESEKGMREFLLPGAPLHTMVIGAICDEGKVYR